MFRIDDPSASATLPAPEIAGTEGYWTEGNPATGTPATLARASWLNMVQEELCAIVAAAGLTRAKTTYNQVLTAINALIAAQKPAFRYVVPFLSAYGSAPASSAFVGDTPVSNFSKTTAQSVFFWFPVTTQIDITKPVKMRIHFTADVAGGNVFLQLGYQDYAPAGALGTVSYTNVTEAIAAPAVAGQLSNVLTATAIIPSAVLDAQDWFNCVISRLPANAGDTNTGNFQLINITLEQ